MRRRHESLECHCGSLGACARIISAVIVVTLARGAAGQSTAPSPGAPRFTGAAMHAAFCSGRAHCEVEQLVEAGLAPDGAPLAVLRVRAGRDPGAEGIECRAYRDWLAVVRRGRVRAVRVLVSGQEPCLEWHPTAWRFERGELIVTYSGMGAPPPASTDTRPITLHLRPWPLTITAMFRADEPVTPPPPVPARGPLVRLSME